MNAKKKRQAEPVSFYLALFGMTVRGHANTLENQLPVVAFTSAFTSAFASA